MNRLAFAGAYAAFLVGAFTMAGRLMCWAGIVVAITAANIIAEEKRDGKY